MIEPDFGGVDAVPMAGLTGFEQEIDASAGRAIIGGMSIWGMAGRGGPCLAVPATFGVRGEVEGGDDLFGCGHLGAGGHFWVGAARGAEFGAFGYAFAKQSALDIFEQMILERWGLGGRWLRLPRLRVLAF